MGGALPAFHPEAVVRFWFSTPGLNQLDPHLTIAIVLLVVTSALYIKRKRRNVDADPEEKMFQHLLHRKAVIEQQISEWKNKKLTGTISEDEYTVRLKEYEKLLKKVEEDLLQYM